jgi:hypothetical protein
MYKALNIAVELDIDGFTASQGYISRFKKRNGLVTRAHTSTQSLPDNAKEIAVEFIKKINNLIRKHSIQKRNILNFDQVPQYFEMESSRTLAKKGSRDVKLKKSSTSHKRFTYTPVVNAEGKVLITHVLFSKLKKIPRDVHEKPKVDVNVTGMWSEIITEQFIKQHILTRAATQFSREPVLLIIDSFGAHLMMDKKFEDKKVFIVFVPENMTGLLQPLDVSFNRPFQQFYADKFNGWIAEAIDDPAQCTKAGNLKVPSYRQVTTWCNDFGEQVNAQLIIDSFTYCGVSDHFNIDECHQALQKLLNGDDLDEVFNSIPTPDDCDLNHFYDNGDTPSLLFDSNLFHFPVRDGNSFFRIISLVLKGKEDDHRVIQKNVTDFMKTFTEIGEVIDQGEIDAMAIDKTRACRATILSAVTLYQRVMLIVSLDSGGEHILFLPGGKDGVDDVGSICMCVQDGFFMYRREYPTEEELSVISYEVATVH